MNGFNVEIRYYCTCFDICRCRKLQLKACLNMEAGHLLNTGADTYVFLNLKKETTGFSTKAFSYVLFLSI
jgi:hypothetical protein